MYSAQVSTSPSQRGFTLIELLVAIAIIAILSVVGITLFVNVQKGARDARRKTDVDAIATAYEVKASGGRYAVIGDADFASGKKPQDPTAAKGDYFNYLASDGSGYKVCASLDNNPSSFCNTSATNCFCKFSSQSTISSSSTADASSTNFGSGPGGSSPSSCDSNGTLYAGLTGYWKMDEGSWTGAAGQVADSSGNGNNGTAYGGANTTFGKLGNAGNFDGSNDYVNAGSAASLNPTTAITIGAWVNLNQVGVPYVITSRQGADGQTYSLWINSDNRLYLYLSSDGATWNMTMNSAVALAAANTWYHLVGTYDRTNLRLYINGAANGTPVGATSNIYSGTATNRISWDSGSTYLNGLIDDVRIYNRALSSQEISNLYNSGNGCI